MESHVVTCDPLLPLPFSSRTGPPAAGIHCHQDDDPPIHTSCFSPKLPPTWDPTYLIPQSTSRPSHPVPQLLGLLPSHFSAGTEPAQPPTPGLLFPPAPHSYFSEPAGSALVRGCCVPTCVPPHPRIHLKALSPPFLPHLCPSSWGVALQGGAH